MLVSDVALLIGAISTLLSAGVAGIILAIAALRNSNAALKNASANTARMDALQKENEKLQDELKNKTAHNQSQDEVILDLRIESDKQQRTIRKYQEWGDRVGREMNRMWLALNAVEVMQGRREEMHDTAPLAPIPNRLDDRPDDN